MHIHETLASILAQLDGCMKPSDAIQPSDSLQHDLGLDSLSVIELIFAIEEKFQIEVTDEELEALKIKRETFHGEWNYTIAPEG